MNLFSSNYFSSDSTLEKLPCYSRGFCGNFWVLKDRNFILFSGGIVRGYGYIGVCEESNGNVRIGD
jgi:hypothetical protein